MMTIRSLVVSEPARCPGSLLSCLVLTLMLWSVSAVGSISVPFIGPDVTHVSYSLTTSSANYTQVQFGFESASGGFNMLLEQEGWGASLSGDYRHAGLTEGDYTYRGRSRRWDADASQWEEWQTLSTTGISVDGLTASGSLRFNETLQDALVDQIWVGSNRTLTASGTLSPAREHNAFINVSGTLSAGDVVFLEHASGTRLNVSLASENHLSGISGGHFVMNSQPQSTIVGSTDVSVRPVRDAKLTNTQGIIIDLAGMSEDSIVTIETSTVIQANSDFCRRGGINLTQSEWQTSLSVSGDCEFIALNSDFSGGVTLGPQSYNVNTPLSDAVFQASDSTFRGLTTNLAAPGTVHIQNSQFAGNVGALFKNPVVVHGGYPVFWDCEFADGMELRNRSGANVQGSIFLDRITFTNTREDAPDNVHRPRWYEASSITPNISNNAFMWATALSYIHRWGEDDALSAPIAIGANYFGDKNGFFHDSEGVVPGFLGYRRGHAGARVNTAWSDAGGWGNPPTAGADAFSVATPLATAPTGTRQDQRVPPRFWVNGHIVGQNVLDHSGRPQDVITLKGRDTLLSVDVRASDNNLSGVRVFAEWDGGSVNARGSGAMHRDLFQFTPVEISLGRATFNLVLPPMAADSVNVNVYLDASSTGFDDAPSKLHLLSETLQLLDPPERPMRIAVSPVEVRGLFGSWGSPSAAAVVQTIREDLPNLMPLPPDKLEVWTRPGFTIFSSTTFFSARLMMTRLAAEVAAIRHFRRGFRPDFVVLVLPDSVFPEGADGLNYSTMRRVLIVSESGATAVLHELGHAIGLYAVDEQYDLYPPAGLPIAGATIFGQESTVAGSSRLQHMPVSQWLRDLFPAYPVASAWFDGHTRYDIMGNVPNVWASPGTRNWFHNWMRQNLTSETEQEGLTELVRLTGEESPMAGRDGTRRVLLTGSVEPGDSDYLGHFSFRPDSLRAIDITDQAIDPVAPATSGAWYNRYRLNTYDSQQQFIDERQFYLTEDDAEWTAWAATFDLPAETASYRIYQVSWAGYNLDEMLRVRSAGLQSNELTRPEPGQSIGHRLEAEWDFVATAAGVQPVLHTLFYRTEPDAEWQLLMPPTDSTAASISTEALPQSDTLSLKLVSSDGLTSVAYVADGLILGERPPLVEIIHPRDQDRGEADLEWQLSARVTAFGDQAPAPGTWISSRDGALGSGSAIQTELSAGTHELRYELVGEDGLTGSDAVNVTVQAVVTSVDLKLEESDLSLHHTGYEPNAPGLPFVQPGETNELMLHVRNQGTQTSARARLFLTPPSGSEALLDAVDLSMEPFTAGLAPFHFDPVDEGVYVVRAVVDQVAPTDPDMSNNERTWHLYTAAPEVFVSAFPEIGGSVSGSGIYMPGTEATVVATPAPGWSFLHWSDGENIVSRSAQYTFECETNCHLIAHFSDDVLFRSRFEQ